MAKDHARERDLTDDRAVRCFSSAYERAARRCSTTMTSHPAVACQREGLDRGALAGDQRPRPSRTSVPTCERERAGIGSGAPQVNRADRPRTAGRCRSSRRSAQAADRGEACPGRGLPVHDERVVEVEVHDLGAGRRRRGRVADLDVLRSTTALEGDRGLLDAGRNGRTVHALGLREANELELVRTRLRRPHRRRFRPSSRRADGARCGRPLRFGREEVPSSCPCALRFRRPTRDHDGHRVGAVTPPKNENGARFGRAVLRERARPRDGARNHAGDEHPVGVAGREGRSDRGPFRCLRLPSRSARGGSGVAYDVMSARRRCIRRPD